MVSDPDAPKPAPIRYQEFGKDFLYGDFKQLRGSSPFAAELLARRAERREGYIENRAVKEAARRFE